MDPKLANWNEESDEVTTLTCEPIEFAKDGTIRFHSGDFTYEGTDAAEAMQALSMLIQHGQKQAQGS